MSNTEEFFNFYPATGEIGERLDKFISKYLSGHSRSYIQNLIVNSNVTKDGVVVSNISHRVVEAKYNLKIPAPTRTSITGANIKLDIIYEDEDLLVINKQPNLSTHPGAGNYNNTLVNGLINYLGDRLSSIGGVERPGIVHRLDKDTCGLIVVAKNDLAHHHLSDQLKTRELSRIYHAICWRNPLPMLGTISTYIKRSSKNRLKMEISLTDGKEAITHYKLLENYNDKLSLIECKLETGRTHQIRVHMAHIGHPILGDEIYGNAFKSSYGMLPLDFAQECKDLQRQALIAKKIGFLHPRSEEYLEFEIDYEPKIKNIIESLRELYEIK